MKRDQGLPYPTWMPARFSVVIIALGHRCCQQRNNDAPTQHNRRAVH